MRATIVTLSISATIALIVLGGLFNAVSGFGFDALAPYNDPARVVATFIGDTAGFALAVAGLGYALYDAVRRGASGWFIGLLVWPVVPLVAASLMYAGALADSIYWFVPLAFLPLASLLYGIIALPTVATVATPAISASPTPPASPTSPAVIGGQSSARSPVRFSVFVGLLALVTLGGGALLLVPNLQPANTVPSGTPVLQVTETSATADCANGIYPPVTLTNTSAQTLQWTAHSQDSNVVTSPAAGSLTPGASVQVAFSGKTTAADIIVYFAASGRGGGGVAKFGCQSGTSK